MKLNLSVYNLMVLLYRHWMALTPRAFSQLVAPCTPLLWFWSMHPNSWLFVSFQQIQTTAHSIGNRSVTQKTLSRITNSLCDMSGVFFSACHHLTSYLTKCPP